MNTATAIDPQTIEARLKKIIAHQLGVKESEVTPEASIVDDLSADSLDTIELVMAIEEEFELEIPDEVAETFVTVHNVLDYVNSTVK